MQSYKSPNFGKSYSSRNILTRFVHHVEALILVNLAVVKIVNPLRRPRGLRQCRAPTWFTFQKKTLIHSSPNFYNTTVPKNSYRFWADLLHKWSFKGMTDIHEYWSKLPCLPIILINFPWATSNNFFIMEKSKFT